jgi:hypothetical protein
MAIASEYAIRNVQETYKGLESNGKHCLLVCMDSSNTLGEKLITKRKRSTRSVRGSQGGWSRSTHRKKVYGNVSLPKCRKESQLTDC